jgi:hypothetical protein
MITRARTMKDQSDSQDLMMIVLVALLQGSTDFRTLPKMIGRFFFKKKMKKKHAKSRLLKLNRGDAGQV